VCLGARERNPFLVVIGRAASPDLELGLASFVTVGKVDTLVVAGDPFDRSIPVNLELLVLGARVTLPDLDFGAVFVFPVNDVETEITSDLNGGGRAGSGV